VNVLALYIPVWDHCYVFSFLFFTSPVTLYLYSVCVNMDLSGLGWYLMLRCIRWKLTRFMVWKCWLYWRIVGTCLLFCWLHATQSDGTNENEQAGTRNIGISFKIQNILKKSVAVLCICRISEGCEMVDLFSRISYMRNHSDFQIKQDKHVKFSLSVETIG
jgi:hypothetical protein